MPGAGRVQAGNRTQCRDAIEGAASEGEDGIPLLKGKDK